ncbi:hypothetical protein ElyMa_001165800 [Elysia marginata]|uniref:Uncharacterized protein n=1 Tax=Elysia marginata TaxID=1093978 RepID=A0AAV4I4Y0_9GAST|nr:hypothetical protein ElyMa_001165800 [Elysia marginata]
MRCRPYNDAYVIEHNRLDGGSIRHGIFGIRVVINPNRTVNRINILMPLIIPTLQAIEPENIFQMIIPVPIESELPTIIIMFAQQAKLMNGPANSQDLIKKIWDVLNCRVEDNYRTPVKMGQLITACIKNGK